MRPPALVAVAHGSRVPAAAEALASLLAEVRRHLPDLDVLGCCLDHGQPRLADVLPGLAEAVVVPLLLGAAYHSEVDVPAAITAAGGGARQAEVLGPDPLLLNALERRMAEAGVVPGDPRTAVVLAAAGSTGAGSVAAVESMARDWATRGWWAVVPAYASAAQPTVGTAVTDLCDRGAPRVVVASYLLFPGRFADAVRRDALAAGAYAVSAPLVTPDAPAPELAILVLARYTAARQWLGCGHDE